MRLEITTKVGCGIFCEACPQGLLIDRYKELYPMGETMMSFSTFKTCLDKTPKDTRIDWSGFCEPFFNEFTTKMMYYADEQGYKQTLFTTLMGCTSEKRNEIEHIDFEEIIIHIPDAEGRAKIQINTELLQRITPTAYHVHGTPRGDVLQYLQRAPTWNELHNRAGNVQHGIARYKSGAVQCGYTGLEIDHNVLLPNGAVAMCCMDFGLTHVLGNLLTQSWNEIRQGEPLKKLKEQMQSNDDCICNFCYRGI